MAARKTSRTTRQKARRRSGQAQETTSQRPDSETASKKKPVGQAKKATKKPTRKRGRPRVSNTSTERVTLRVESDHLSVIDTLVSLGEYSNRSDAVRHAIREFVESAIEDVEEMKKRHEKRQKLMQLAAFKAELSELEEA